METSIITTITEASTGKKRKRSFTNINPNATNTELKTFAQTIVGLTTGNYDSTDRVDKINVDTEPTPTPTGDKNFRNMTFNGVEPGGTATLSAVIVEDETINPLIMHLSGTTLTLIEGEDVSTDPLLAEFEFTVPQSGTLFAGLVEKDTEWEKFYPDFIREQI